MKPYILLAATALMLAACTNDEVTTTPDGEVALKVNAAISGTNTRASGTDWADGDRIGITGGNYTNSPYAYGSGKFAATGQDIYFEDPEDNPDTPRFRVTFDDDSIEEMLHKVSDAIDRAQSIDKKLQAAQTAEERAELTEMMTRLEKRVIVAFIGTEGYDKLLEWMGEGKPIDPSKYTSMLGEVMASFLMLLGRKATNGQLRKCGLYYSQESAQTKAFLQAQRKNQPKVINGGKGKKSRK